MPNKKRKFNGYAVVTRQGRYLRQYSRATEAEAREAYEKHNPQVEGHVDGYKIAKETVFLEPLEE